MNVLKLHVHKSDGWDAYIVILEEEHSLSLTRGFSLIPRIPRNTRITILAPFLCSTVSLFQLWVYALNL